MSHAKNAMTQADFARYRGVSRVNVTKWKSRGLLVFEADGRVAVTESDARLAARPETFRGGSVKPGPVLTNAGGGNTSVHSVNGERIGERGSEHAHV